MEIWKDIRGYENKYQVSNLGRIRNLKKGKILIPHIEEVGYTRICLCIDGQKNWYRVHRIVAMTFIPNTELKREVNHKNGIKNDNRVENLEWCSRLENMQHAVKVLNRNLGNFLGAMGRNHPRSKAVNQFTRDGILVKTYECGMEARRAGFSTTCISRCCNGEQSHYKDFIWQFA